MPIHILNDCIYPSLTFTIAALCITPSFAAELPDCTPLMKKDTQCIIHAEDLHPTQFAVGVYMVEKKKHDLEKLAPTGWQKFLKEHPVPIIIGPGNIFYATDHHHLARAVLDSGHSRMVAAIQENWQTLESAHFWATMEHSHYVYLYDNKGRGPLSTNQLPSSIDQLPDDPYRSLAAVARHQGCYQKSTQPFAEFQWAQYFRTRVIITHDMTKDAKAALPFRRVPEASDLPGFITQSE